MQYKYWGMNIWNNLIPNYNYEVKLKNLTYYVN